MHESFNSGPQEPVEEFGKIAKEDLFNEDQKPEQLVSSRSDGASGEPEEVKYQDHFYDKNPKTFTLTFASQKEYQNWVNKVIDINQEDPFAMDSEQEARMNHLLRLKQSGAMKENEDGSITIVAPLRRREAEQYVLMRSSPEQLLTRRAQLKSDIDAALAASDTPTEWGEGLLENALAMKAMLSEGKTDTVAKELTSFSEYLWNGVYKNDEVASAEAKQREGDNPYGLQYPVLALYNDDGSVNTAEIDFLISKMEEDGAALLLSGDNIRAEGRRHFEQYTDVRDRLFELGVTQEDREEQSWYEIARTKLFD